MRLRFFQAFVAGLYSLTLLSFLFTGSFSRMMADDYCTAYMGLEQGAWGLLVWNYENWSGLYTNFFLKGLLAPFQPEIHVWQTAIFILLWLPFLYAALWQVSAILRLPRRHLVVSAATLLLAVGIINGATSRQTLYWFSAIIPYGLPIIGITAWIAMFLWTMREARSIRTILMVTGIGIVLSFLNSGLSETAATLQITALFFVLLFCYWKIPSRRRDSAIIVIGTMIGSIVALGIIVTSPGAAERAVRFEGVRPVGLLSVMGWSLNFTTRFLVSELYGVMNIMFIFLLTGGGLFWFYPPDGEHRLADFPMPSHIGLWLILSGGAIYILTLSVVGPVTLGTGNVVPRTLFIARASHIVLGMFWGYMAAVSLARYPLLKRLRHRLSFRLARLAIITGAFLVPVIVLVTNFSQAADAATYAQAWDERHHRFQQLPAGESVTLEPLPVYFEESLALDTPQDSVSVLGCLGRFYDLDVTVVTPEEELETQ